MLNFVILFRKIQYLDPKHKFMLTLRKKNHEKKSQLVLVFSIYLLKNEELSDVSLKGNDNVVVHANRLILTTRSEVSWNMLYRGF